MRKQKILYLFCAFSIMNFCKSRVKTSSFGGAISVYAYNAPDI
nr:MAG TPA: hypothetical protein [Caudoviricetes sp.]